jgi:hypothetical protein
MKGVGIDDVLDHVAGYLPANDVGLHDFRHADRGSMPRVKGQDGFLPVGPKVVPASEFDPTSFTLPTTLNDEVVQEATADDLIWGVAYQLADVNRLITLEPGDLVLTGTPAHSRPMALPAGGPGAAPRRRPLRGRLRRLAVVLGARRRAAGPRALALQGGVLRRQRAARRRAGHDLHVHLGRPGLRDGAGGFRASRRSSARSG